MNCEAMQWAMGRSCASASSKMVLMAVAALSKDGVCDADQETIARHANLSARQTRTCLDELCLAEWGLLSKERRGGNGAGRQSNLYRLSMPEELTAEIAFSYEAKGTYCRQPTAEIAVSPPEQIAVRANGNSPHTPLVPNSTSKDVSLGVSEPSVPRPVVKIVPDGFAEIWALWPQRGRSSKAKSAKLWAQRLRSSSAEKLAAAARRYLDSPDARKEGGHFVPALERWLVNRLDSWLEDDVPQAQERSDEEIRWAALYQFFDQTGRWREAAYGPPPYTPGHRGPRKQQPQQALI